MRRLNHQVSWISRAGFAMNSIKMNGLRKTGINLKVMLGAQLHRRRGRCALRTRAVPNTIAPSPTRGEGPVPTLVSHIREEGTPCLAYMPPVEMSAPCRIVFSATSRGRTKRRMNGAGKSGGGPLSGLSSAGSCAGLG
jgi:hypothetical protein